MIGNMIMMAGHVTGHARQVLLGLAEVTHGVMPFPGYILLLQIFGYKCHPATFHVRTKGKV